MLSFLGSPQNGFGIAVLQLASHFLLSDLQRFANDYPAISLILKNQIAPIYKEQACIVNLQTIQTEPLFEGENFGSLSGLKLSVLYFPDNFQMHTYFCEGLDPDFLISGNQLETLV